MGDYADCITEKDKRWDNQGLASWVERDNIVESQRQFVTRLFKPIKNKCIGFLTGNHEESMRRYFQFNFTQNICNDLDIPYAGYHCFVRLLFKRANSAETHQYIIHAWHGAGSAQTEGARLMRLKRLVGTFQADIYLMGHLHAITKDITDRIALRGDRVKQTPQIAAMTGSWVKGYTQDSATSYIEMQGYKPSHLGCPSIIIIPNDDKIIYQCASSD